MKRYIAILTLALTAGLSADDAFSAQANAFPQIALSNTAEGGLDEISESLIRFTATDDLWLIIDIAENPEAAYETLIDMGVPAQLAEDIVLEAAIAIPAFIRYQIKADNTHQTPE